MCKIVRNITSGPISVGELPALLEIVNNQLLMDLLAFQKTLVVFAQCSSSTTFVMDVWNEVSIWKTAFVSYANIKIQQFMEIV